MKRLVFCCDGTWSRPDQASPTNVTRFHAAIPLRGADGVEQVPGYGKGVGTSLGDRLRGGAFGYGLTRNVKAAYRFVVEHFEPGDEIFLVGFSRGAYTARSTAGLIRNSGVLRREHAGRLDEAYELYRSRERHPRGEEAQRFRDAHSHETRIRFIGVWDTVGALGIPLNGLRLIHRLNRRWQFHDTKLSTTVDRAHQALAIDEERGPFVPTMWDRQPGAGDQVLEQVWFAGDHSDVGGGHGDRALADIALLWMADRAAAAGLTFLPDAFTALRPGADGLVHRSRRGFFALVRPHVRRPGREPLPGAGDPAPGQSVASSARDRIAAGGYGSTDLRAFLDGGGAVTPVRLAAGPPPAGPV
ncbi:DUF2235 domain-containing protein [Miltoncostaea marina]|uniref:DUF2235 domain-containing protein n=1 Tax=Miltoncostaea marina TaxID=2843215 RepID=UPI001C3DC556|nr:DUF2235 domain-containing protein [Miltoncostaea marina]